jgi:hypothetical protein
MVKAKPRKGWTLTGALLAALLAAACSSPPPGQLDFIQPDAFAIANPSRTHASASGIGCGFTEKEALLVAQRVSAYNLRSLTGPARYQVAFEVLRTFPRDKEHCVEVAARASP